MESKLNETTLLEHFEIAEMMAGRGRSLLNISLQAKTISDEERARLRREADNLAIRAQNIAAGKDEFLQQ